jgi:D-serine dehydratase
MFNRWARTQVYLFSRPIHSDCKHIAMNVTFIQLLSLRFKVGIDGFNSCDSLALQKKERFLSDTPVWNAGFQNL